MKTFIKNSLFLIFLNLVFTANSQTVNHSTINKTGIVYRLIPAIVDTTSNITSNQTSNSSVSTSTLNVRSEVSIYLKPIQNISKIYLKILTQNSNNILYQVSYLFNPLVVTNANGIILFEKSGNKIVIRNPNTFLLDHYKYEIVTENSNGVQSELFTITK